MYLGRLEDMAWVRTIGDRDTVAEMRFMRLNARAVREFRLNMMKYEDSMARRGDC